MAALAGCTTSVAGPGGIRTTGAGPTGKVSPGGIVELRGNKARAAAIDPKSATGVFADFSARLFKAAGSGGNSVLSPFSVLSAIGMTQVGSAGMTAALLATLLGGDGKTTAGRVSAVERALAAAVQQANAQADEDGATAIDSANSLFVQSGLDVHQSFLDALSAGYDAALRMCDFRADPGASRDLINTWVSKNTAGLIPELLSPEAITTATRFAIVNALHLKAPWEGGFEKGSVASPFRTAEGKSVSLPLMSASGEMPYATGPGWSSVSLPYTGRGLAMTVIRPDAGKFEQVWSALDGAMLSAAQAGQTRRVDVKLPAFKIDTSTDLLGVLDRMSGQSTFSHADLSGIAGKPGDLEIGSIVHQAKISVDEHGTEAAAATAVVVAAGAMPGPHNPPKTVQFVVDRAFLFCVHDTETFTPLFLGRVSDPTA